MDIQSEIKKLYDCRLLRNELECEEFDAVLENIADYTDGSMIEDLCLVFDDETQEEEVMFGLLHLIESFERQQYLTEMSKALPKMMENASEWATILNIRILNNELYRMEYTKILAYMNSDVKLTVIGLLEEIIADDPQKFESVATEIILELKGS